MVTNLKILAWNTKYNFEYEAIWLRLKDFTCSLFEDMLFNSGASWIVPLFNSDITVIILEIIFYY